MERAPTSIASTGLKTGTQLGHGTELAVGYTLRCIGGDLLQAPLIVISGNEALKFTDAQSALLKSYLDAGGTLLFDAAAGPAAAMQRRSMSA